MHWRTSSTVFRSSVNLDIFEAKRYNLYRQDISSRYITVNVDSSEMDVFIVTEEGPAGVNYIGASLNAIKARQIFNAYLDAMEKILREESGNITPDNTFNRFSEATDDYLLYAVLGDTSIYVRRLDAE